MIPSDADLIALLERLEHDREWRCGVTRALVAALVRELLASRQAKTCATCLFHNPSGPLCKRGMSRPNTIVPSLRVDANTFGCNLHEQPAPDAKETP